MQVILNRERLKVLRDLALLDNQTEVLYDRMTTLASQIIGAPVSLVSMVAADYQFFTSHTGLPEPWKSARRTPLSHSFCQHVVAESQPLIVTDAREHDLVRDNMAIVDLDVIGYLGMPLTLQDGKSLGSFCVIDSQPRAWTPVEVEIVREIADIITHEIDLRALAQHDSSYQPQYEAGQRAINQLLDSLDTRLPKESFLTQLRAARAQFDL